MFRALLRSSPVLALLAASPVLAAPPEVAVFRTQKVGDTTYFQVAFHKPADLTALPMPRVDVGQMNESVRRRLARMPRLVPQDDRSDAVCFVYRTSTGHYLEFVGRLHSGKEAAKFLLLYPSEKKPEILRTIVPQLAREDFVQVAVRLDPEKAEAFAPPRKDAAERFAGLDEVWAHSRAEGFAVLEALCPDFGYYGLARELTARRHKLSVPPIDAARAPAQEAEYRRLYEMSTGATALTESLALNRMRGGRPEPRADRTIHIDDVRGVTIGEHPWEKMMAGRKPAAEPLAGLVPHDNWYLAFKSIRSFIELGEHMDQWGTNALRAWDYNSRDTLLKQRYEKQLCLGSTGLAKTLGPAIIRGVALTGSDLYFREGTDLTVIFHVKNRELFLASVATFIERARKEHGERLREGKEEYRGVKIETFTTPRREVSLNRASVDDYVIYSNSPAALRRVLDTQAGRNKALAESLDFQYMRTVFKRDEAAEDGFAFLSDALIRQLVGPASKIKEKRRIEALTSLNLATNGALFAVAESGKLPADREALLTASGLKEAELDVPEGKVVTWDGEARVAFSDEYNTIHFARPLCELPITRITPREKTDYDAFRDDYMRLWRRFFDPVGIRLSLTNERIRIETYILPLINNSAYNELRRQSGNGSATFDLSTVSPRTMFQFFAHLSPQEWPRSNTEGAIGDWFTLRWEDSPAYRQMLASWVKREFGELSWEELQNQEAGLFLQLPFTLGVKIGNEKSFDQLFSLAEQLLPNEFRKETVKYRGIDLQKLTFNPDSKVSDEVNRALGLENAPKEKRIEPVLYHAKIGGVWYAGFTERTFRDMIDQVGGRKGDKTDVNTSVYIAPEAIFEAREAMRGYLEWETHRRATANTPLWEVLYQAGVVKPGDGDDVCARTAFHYFGFVPVSHDGALYRFDQATREVVNARHGSLRRPRLHDDLAPKSPLADLLQQLRTIRADLLFREDGIHTTLTLDRRVKKE
jgi:hypothetical protein